MAGKPSKPMTWTMTALMFVWMATVTFGLTMIFNHTMRQQVWLINSDFWKVVVPADLVAIAILVMAMRFTFNRHLAGRDRVNLNTDKDF
jgi:hypothetical protein